MEQRLTPTVKKLLSWTFGLGGPANTQPKHSRANGKRSST